MANEISIGAQATNDGIRHAIVAVTSMHRRQGRAAVQAMTEEQWRAQALANTEPPNTEDYRGPYVLAYVTAARILAEQLSDLS